MLMGFIVEHAIEKDEYQLFITDNKQYFTEQLLLWLIHSIFLWLSPH